MFCCCADRAPEDQPPELGCMTPQVSQTQSPSGANGTQHSASMAHIPMNSRESAAQLSPGAPGPPSPGRGASADPAAPGGRPAKNRKKPFTRRALEVCEQLLEVMVLIRGLY
uniref:Uncharacterized protein n=1 Tax=Rhizochromulina marina TaxID=1034831 RepID=A0A7S2W1T2_9STRA